MRHGARHLRLPAILLLACGGSQSSTVDLAAFFEAERVEQARREAPDLVASAEFAREEAEHADDPNAAADHATRARLLLDAAVVEAERAALDRRRVVVLEAADVATVAAVAADDRRVLLQQRAARRRAAEVAREQMRVALEQAEIDEPRRLRGRTEAVTAARRDAARALLSRAQLLVAAARGLGAPSEGADEVEHELSDLAGRVRANAADSLGAVDEAHRHALALLGDARRAHPVAASSIDSLATAIRERGYDVDLRPEGLVLTGRLLRGNRLDSGRVSAVAEIASAHPHGPIQVRGRHAARIAAALRELGDRVQYAATREDPEIVFVAYGATR